MTTIKYKCIQNRICEGCTTGCEPLTIGRVVVYHSPHTPDNAPGQEGVISSVNDHYVFVRYGNSATSQATPVDRLEFCYCGDKDE